MCVFVCHCMSICVCDCVSRYMCEIVIVLCLCVCVTLLRGFKQVEPQVCVNKDREVT